MSGLKDKCHQVCKTASDVPGSMSIIVLGASGDLAKKKTYPALFALYCQNLLPKHATIVGYARSNLSPEKFRSHITACIKPTGSDAELLEPFLSHCFYTHGQYDSEEDFSKLNDFTKQKEEEFGRGEPHNRVFYLALPPSVFVDVSRCIRHTCMSKSGYNRIIVEKPFGRDLATSDELQRDLSALFSEDEIYRMDHYLGKEIVQNLLVLRFANLAFSSIWNRHCIANVQITFKEDIGVEGRGGYFDQYGIIRDVMQNHLLQVLSLVAMEPPVSLNAEDVTAEKVKVLRYITPIQRDQIVIGQYTAGNNQCGYIEDPTVPKGSITPTFSTAVVHINNERWSGVPFVLKCGKGLNEKKAEIRIQLHDQPNGNLFDQVLGRNEIVIRVQPEEAIYMKFTAKQPGLSVDVTQTELDMTFKSRFREVRLPDAYERLIHDVLRGEHRDFVSADELHEAWKIFTPILHQLENEHVVPESYAFGSRGPESSDELIANHGYKRKSDYVWVKPQ